MSKLSELTPREKLLIGLAAGVLSVTAIWLYVWQPLSERYSAQQDRIARYASILNIVERAPETAAQAMPACTRTGALAPRVVESAEAAGIVLARLDPQGGALRVTVADSAYDAAIDWIAELEARSCVRATSVQMSRLTAPGQVTLRITLQEAGP